MIFSRTAHVLSPNSFGFISYFGPLFSSCGFPKHTLSQTHTRTLSLTHTDTLYSFSLYICVVECVWCEQWRRRLGQLRHRRLKMHSNHPLICRSAIAMSSARAPRGHFASLTSPSSGFTLR